MTHFKVGTDVHKFFRCRAKKGADPVKNKQTLLILDGITECLQDTEHGEANIKFFRKLCKDDITVTLLAIYTLPVIVEYSQSEF